MASETEMPVDPERFAQELEGADEDELLRAIEEFLPEVWEEVHELAAEMTADKTLQNRLIRLLMPGALLRWLRSQFPDLDLGELCKKYCELRRKHGGGINVIQGIVMALFAATDYAVTAGMVTASAAAIFYLLAKICRCDDVK